MTPQQFIDLFNRQIAKESLNDDLHFDGDQSTIYPDLGEDFYIEINLTISPQYATTYGGTDDFGNKEYLKEEVDTDVNINELNVYHNDEPIEFTPEHIGQLEDIIKKNL